MAHLPPLARLRLGASTGNDADSDEEHAHEPLDRRAYRKFPKLAPAPDVTTLAKMPAEVVEILVEHTAIAARAEDEPARAMCEWMKALCRTAKLAGVAGCADHWYYLALAAFGFTPAPTEVAGEAPALPAYSAFPNWRAFFGALCEAFYGTGVKNSNGHESRSWLKGEDALFRYVRYRVEGLMGVGNDTSRTFVKRFLDPDASQRTLDKRLDELLDGELERRSWARANRDAGGHFPRQGWTWHESRVLDVRPQEEDRLNLSVVHWINEVDSELSADTSPWAAVVTLFLLRGAKPFQASKYRKLDQELWGVVGMWGVVEQSDQVNTGQLTGMDEFRAQSMVKARKCLDEGADPNFQWDVHRDPIIYMALDTRSDELLALMFAHGAHMPHGAGFEYRFFQRTLEMMFVQPILPDPKPWPYSEDTTATLIAWCVAHWEGTVPEVRRYNLTRIRGYVADRTRTPAWLAGLWERLMPNIVTNTI